MRENLFHPKLRLGMFLSMFLFFLGFQPGCSYKRCSYKLKKVYDMSLVISYFAFSAGFRMHENRRSDPSANVDVNAATRFKSDAAFTQARIKELEDVIAMKVRVSSVMKVRMSSP